MDIDFRSYLIRKRRRGGKVQFGKGKVNTEIRGNEEEKIKNN